MDSRFYIFYLKQPLLLYFFHFRLGQNRFFDQSLDFTLQLLRLATLNRHLALYLGLDFGNDILKGIFRKKSPFFAQYTEGVFVCLVRQLFGAAFVVVR